MAKSARIRFNKEDAASFLANNIKEAIDIHKPFLVACIGTDSCIGDSLGPIVGYMLKLRNYSLPVEGTLQEPIHALNIADYVRQLNDRFPGYSVIAIDASLGDKEDVGDILIRKYPVHPGKSLGKKLPSIGDISIVGVVDTYENNIDQINTCVRLNYIVELASVIADALLIISNELYPEKKSLINTVKQFFNVPEILTHHSIV